MHSRCVYGVLCVLFFVVGCLHGYARLGRVIFLFSFLPVPVRAARWRRRTSRAGPRAATAAGERPLLSAGNGGVEGGGEVAGKWGGRGRLHDAPSRSCPASLLPHRASARGGGSGHTGYLRWHPPVRHCCYARGDQWRSSTAAAHPAGTATTDRQHRKGDTRPAAWPSWRGPPPAAFAARRGRRSHAGGSTPHPAAPPLPSYHPLSPCIPPSQPPPWPCRGLRSPASLYPPPPSHHRTYTNVPL